MYLSSLCGFVQVKVRVGGCLRKCKEIVCTSRYMKAQRTHPIQLILHPIHYQCLLRHTYAVHVYVHMHVVLMQKAEPFGRLYMYSTLQVGCHCKSADTEVFRLVEGV